MCSLCAAEDWVGDDCFEFFNPATTAGVEHYTRTWSDALVTGIEYFSDKLAPGLLLKLDVASITAPREAVHLVRYAQ